MDMAIGTFTEGLLALLEAQGMPMSDLEKAGVTRDQVYKMKGRGGRTNVEDARKIAAFLGLTIEQIAAFPSEPAEPRILDPEMLELVHLWSQLSMKERRILLAGAREAADVPSPEEG